MAVYEHGYKPYAGALTPEWSRFLIIPRHAYRDVFRSKFFIAFFALCFIYPLVAAILIYLHHNVNALSMLKIDGVRELIPIDASFFYTFITTQCSLGFFLTLLIGPPLVSRDLANNALPLYLCRPFSRAEYVLGKASVLVILLSLVMLVPGMLLFIFQSYLEGFTWLKEYYWIANAIFWGSAIWIAILTLSSLALSAWIKWRVAASGALFAIFIIPMAIATFISELFRTPWSHLFNPGMLLKTVNESLFHFTTDTPPWMNLPVSAGWIGIACLILLNLFFALAQSARL